MSSSKIYVGNIPSNMSEQELKTYFQSFSPQGEFTLVKVAKDGSAKGGFGFLVIENQEEKNAILAHQHVISGHPLKCEQYLGNDEPAVVKNSLRRRRLFIRNLKKCISDEDLFQFFQTYGELESAYSVKAHASQKARSFGYVTFKSEEPAVSLVKTGKVTIKGVEVSVHPFRKSAETAHEANQQSPAFSTANQNSEFSPSSNLIGRGSYIHNMGIPSEMLESATGNISVSRHQFTRGLSSQEKSSSNSEGFNLTHKNSSLLRRGISGTSARGSLQFAGSNWYSLIEDPAEADYSLFEGFHFIKAGNMLSSHPSLEGYSRSPKRTLNHPQEMIRILGSRRISPQRAAVPSNPSQSSTPVCLQFAEEQAVLHRSAKPSTITDLAHSSKPTHRSYFQRVGAVLNHHSSNIELKVLTTPRLRLSAARSLEISAYPANNHTPFPFGF